MTSWLAERARSTPLAPALESERERLDYAALAERAAVIAARLQSIGVAAGDRIAFTCGGDAMADALLLHGLWWLGATAVPLPGGQSIGGLDVRLATLQIRRLSPAERGELDAPAEIADTHPAEPNPKELPEIADTHPAEPHPKEPHPDTHPDAPATLRRAPGRAPADIHPDMAMVIQPHPDTHAYAPATLRRALADIHPDTAMIILFSSGSEHGPKAIVLSACQLAAGVDAAAERLALSADDCWLCCLSLAHIGGLAILLRAVRTGASVQLHERFDAAATAAAIERHADQQPITRLSLVPTMLHDLLNHHPARFDGRLKSVLIGGAPAAPELLARARAAGLPVLPTWGMTEAGSQLATPSLERAADIDFLAHPLWVGAPLPGVEVRTRADGRLEVRGPMLFSALPSEADGPDAQGWYTTGDCGLIDDRGELTITGRAARVLISGGVNVHLDAVEQRIRAAGLIADIALLAVDDPRWGERVIAAYRPHPDDDRADTDAALDRWARSELRPAERPLRWHRIESLPRSATGKILYAELAVTLGLRPPGRTSRG